MKANWSIAIVLICMCGCDVNPTERTDAGNELYEQGQYESALGAYQAAQVALPDSFAAYYNAASVYSQMGEFDKAIDALHQALKSPDSELKTLAYYNLGNVYFQLYRFDDAVESYQEALRLNPKDEDARHNLEVAMKRLIVLSPSPIIPTDPAIDEGNTGDTPTPDVSNQPTVPVSGTATISTSEPSSLTRVSTVGELPATISLDDAEAILDAVQQAQQSLPNSTSSGTPVAVKSDKNW